MKPVLVRKTHPAVIIALGLGLTGFAALAGGQGGSAQGADGATQQPVRCELRIDALPGQTVFGGQVSADRPVHGSYRLGISSRSAGGSATISQSGDFEARPGVPALLGETRLGGTPAGYRAELEISFEGRRMGCRETL
ncbi:MAG: hypothetical protein JJT95_18315 [Pararhodobacter sp.]|nr:hypothetical protein [Pararhodobacter sp.]